MEKEGRKDPVFYIQKFTQVIKLCELSESFKTDKSSA